MGGGGGVEYDGPAEKSDRQQTTKKTLREPKQTGVDRLHPTTAATNRRHSRHRNAAGQLMTPLRLSQPIPSPYRQSTTNPQAHLKRNQRS